MTEPVNISEWIMVGITLIYSVVTFCILRSNKDSVKEMKISRDLAYRPEIIAFFYEKQGGLYFQIKNIGSRAAFDTTITINPGFNIHTYLDYENFMEINHDETNGSYHKKEIKLLAPNQQLETFVAIQQQIINSYNESIKITKQNEDSLDAKINLSYYDYNKKNSFKETYPVTLLDFQKDNGIRINGTHEAVKELSQLNKNLLKIKDDLNNSTK